MANMFNKYLVLRRDGTVPEWPYLVLGAKDPAVPFAIEALADESQRQGMDADYVSDLRRLADYFDYFRHTYGEGDPDAPAHRQDNPEIVSQITHGSTVPAGFEIGRNSSPTYCPWCGSDVNERGHDSDCSRPLHTEIKLTWSGRVLHV